MTTNKASRKDKKDKKDIKKKSVIKLRKSVTKLRKRRTRRTKPNSNNLSDLYTYESPVTNNAGSLSKSNSNYNINVVHGLKDFLAVKK